MFITNQYSTVDTRGIDTDTTAVPVDYSVPGIQIYNHKDQCMVEPMATPVPVNPYWFQGY